MSSIEIPLIKIDFDNAINKVLSKSEAKEFWNQPNSIISKVKSFKNKIRIKISTKHFKGKDIEECK